MRRILIAIFAAICLSSILYAGPLARIYICPRDLGLAAGAKQQFTVYGEDSDGNPVSPGTVTWSATPPSGSITASGLFTAAGVGKYYSAVTATAGGFTATADVEVYSSPPQAGYTLERSIGCLNAGAIDSPREIGLDGAGNAYILSTSGNSVNKFNSSGILTAQFRLLNPVTDQSLLAVTSDGTMYVADPEAYCIRKYDPSGNFVTQWGSEGSGSGQFYDLTDIAVDLAGQVYVADGAKCCIDAFSANGAFLRSWRTPNHEYLPGYYVPPAAIAVDSWGHIWAWAYDSNFDHPELQQYDSDGRELSWRGAWFENAWKFNDHYDYPLPITFPMAVDSAGNVYQAYQDHIAKLAKSRSSDYPAIWPLPNAEEPISGTATGMVVGPSDTIYVTDSENNSVTILDSNGQFLCDWRSSGSDKGQLKSPSGIAVDASGNIFVSDTGNRRVQEFDPNGGFIRELASMDQKDSAFACPSGLTIDTQGNLYVADCANPRILVYGSNASLSSIWTVPCLFGLSALPMGLVRNPSSGWVYLADAGYRMDAFTPGGGYSSSWMDAPGSGDGWVNTPAGIALDSQRLEYISDYGNNRIQKCNGGVFVTKWGTLGIGSGQFNGPAGICIDSTDTVYVADSGNGRIQKFSSAGVYLSQLGSPGFGPFQFTDPEAVAVDAAGNLYVADTGNHRILKFKKVEPPTVTITGPTTSPTYTTSRSTIDLSGTSTGQVVAISWSSDRGASGSCAGTSSWTATGVPLKTGSNVITVTARDAYGSTVSDTITITSTAPTVSITSPTTYQSYLTIAGTISLAGTATASGALLGEAWSNDRGGNGACTGTTSWTASNITLQPGRNTLTITAQDTTHRVASVVLVVYRATTAATTISAAKQNASGGNVYLTDQSVTAIFDDCFYIEQANRASAIKVLLPFANDLKSIGNTVDVGGTLTTGADGERYIDGAAKTKS